MPVVSTCIKKERQLGYSTQIDEIFNRNFYMGENGKKSLVMETVFSEIFLSYCSTLKISS